MPLVEGFSQIGGDKMVDRLTEIVLNQGKETPQHTEHHNHRSGEPECGFDVTTGCRPCSEQPLGVVYGLADVTRNEKLKQ
ncbi:MAG: hypothetical protein Ct9H300mP16_11410 [Pseudomonadota bacterium]|nr:MAG: hypothetical protein Ct9H300mP16_11410 [Pseudomonadota bacterium]